MALLAKYSNSRRRFRIAPGNRFISVYINGRLSGFIWNTDKVIQIDGEKIVSYEFFTNN